MGAACTAPQAEENDPLGRAPGEWLWGDDAYGYAAALKKEKASQPPMNWASLFMQRPAPETGIALKLYG